MNAYYESRWSGCRSEVVRPVRSPFGREVIDTVPVCNEETVDLAVRHLFLERTRMEEFTGDRMGPVFQRAGAAMRERSEALAALITREQGKPLAESREEVAVAASLVETFSQEAYRLGGQFQPLAVEARVGDRFGFTRQRPLGVQAILSANTFPLLLPTMLAVPAWAAGNVVVLKPASATPFSALRMVEIFLQAGLPPTAVACLTGPGSITGQAVCRHPLVDQVSCYGSMDTIRAVRSAIGLIPLQFHHGGMTVCLIAEDADVDLAVSKIVAQGFENAGQTAISAGAVYAAERVHDEVVDRLAAALGALPCGDPAAPGTRIGPLTEESRAVRASRMVGDWLASGARLVCGNGVPEGNLLVPTLVAGVPGDYPDLFPPSSGREFLAPIMSVSRIAGPLEGVASCLDRRSQPAVSLFSRDLERAAALARCLPVFNVHVNGVPTWRDGVIFTSQSASRLGRRQSEHRVRDVSSLQDIVFHPAA
jgi:acyl-CoA reductase-like NAD-dependent aldehyde dehydrogenase